MPGCWDSASTTGRTADGRHLARSVRRRRAGVPSAGDVQATPRHLLLCVPQCRLPSRVRSLPDAQSAGQDSCGQRQLSTVGTRRECQIGAGGDDGFGLPDTEVLFAATRSPTPSFARCVSMYTRQIRSLLRLQCSSVPLLAAPRSERPTPQLPRPSMMTVSETSPHQSTAWDIATRWCTAQGQGWAPTTQLGLGGTAPVFEVQSPSGLRALKIYDAEFSSGKMGEIEYSRIQQQLSLRDHDCPSLVHVYDGGTIEDRLFLLMSRAPGTELEKRLPDIPRSKIRSILHDIAQACLFLQTRGLCHRDIKAANVFVSDDLSRATLLDISVIRAIHDPVGVGSDRDGQLPVLATARYSPLEYLFRLVDPGPLLWHALNIYQLGALLHDLIVRASLFQAEYEQSKSNRYRFAWIVATQEPHIDVADVDQDLLFLARRALDKNWERRSVLHIEDFFNDSTRREQHAFQMLGLHRRPDVQVTPNIQKNRIHLDHVSNSLKEHLVAYFLKAGVTTVHHIMPGPNGDNSRTIELRWNTTDELVSTVEISLCCTLRLLINDLGVRFEMIMKLSKQVNDDMKSTDMNLPDVPDDEHSLTKMANQCESAFAVLAKNLLQPDEAKT